MWKNENKQKEAGIVVFDTISSCDPNFFESKSRRFNRVHLQHMFCGRESNAIWLNKAVKKSRTQKTYFFVITA